MEKFWCAAPNYAPDCHQEIVRGMIDQLLFGKCLAGKNTVSLAQNTGSLFCTKIVSKI